MERRITRAQTGMRLLGLFHYLFALLLALMVVLLLSNGTRTPGALFHEKSSPELSFLNEYDDETAGLTVIVILSVQALIELFLGWSARKKAGHPEKMRLTLLLSGGNIALSLLSLLRSGFVNVEWSEMIYNLTLNTVAFLLALWIKRAYDRQRQT